ncbi:GNAT family N-acetyltransferase [Conexibacter woesei]|uniref:Acetyltransferase n=1 Tax=Conexibacter woesei (strain DSM 14684 / CCUG 47730 / CIP 108061 / JCM 11494 / NBRC 100937 / ID131577) TaxID=469383 RepID=D3EZW6_CONWI|nr:N-acetyltransferase [Conexibacter woesei]ADB49942.1 acetyltransferase [Conexibacter woesei DSM 14684]
MTAAHTLTDDPGARRYELRAGADLLGWTEYLPAGDSVILAHTEVLEGHEGEGLGGELVRGTFAQIAALGKTVIPLCPFAAAYVRRHPELLAQVAPSMRAQLSSG